MAAWNTSSPYAVPAVTREEADKPEERGDESRDHGDVDTDILC